MFITLFININNFSTLFYNFICILPDYSHIKRPAETPK